MRYVLSISNTNSWMVSGTKEEEMSLTILDTVPSKSVPGKTYEIRKGGDGTIYCTCPAWKFQRVSPGHNQRTCKHLTGWCAKQLATRGEDKLPLIPKDLAAHLLSTAASKKANAKEAERRFQEARKAQQELTV